MSNDPLLDNLYPAKESPEGPKEKLCKDCKDESKKVIDKGRCQACANAYYIAYYRGLDISRRSKK